MGHSLGGYTVLGMAGAWKSWKDPRIKAAVLFSPYAKPYSTNGDLAEVDIPVMLQGGTRDFGITPFLDPIYRTLKEPAVYLVLKDENHFSWTNLISLNKTTVECVAGGNAELMVRYSVAFFDQHLRTLDRADVLQKQDVRLDTFRFK